jgi:hypothetical protein
MGTNVSPWTQVEKMTTEIYDKQAGNQQYSQIERKYVSIQKVGPGRC